MVRALLLPLLLLPAACAGPVPPPDNGTPPTAIATPIASRAVRIGTEGSALPACPSITRVLPAGTTLYWAPGETRVAKARLGGDLSLTLCEATPDDQWFGVVIPTRDLQIGRCGVSRPVAAPREYQGPCRWGWIKGGQVRLGG